MKQNKATKFARGQVWYYTENPVITRIKLGNSHVIAKSRPVLIISSNKHIESSTLAVIPISTHGITPFDITFISTDGKTCRFCVEQITTIDASRLESYMYSIGEYTMNLVEEKIIDRLGLYMPRESQRKTSFGIQKTSYKMIADVEDTSIPEVFADAQIVPREELKYDPKFVDENGKPEEPTAVLEEPDTVETVEEDASTKIFKILGRDPVYPEKKGENYRKWSSDSIEDLKVLYKALSKEQLEEASD